MKTWGGEFQCSRGLPLGTNFLLWKKYRFLKLLGGGGPVKSPEASAVNCPAPEPFHVSVDHLRGPQLLPVSALPEAFGASCPLHCSCSPLHTLLELSP